MTLHELRRWLSANHVNENAIRVGPSWPFLVDGHAVVQEGEHYLFFYVARGERSHIEHFDQEAQVCERALAHLSGDRWAFAHLVGLFPTHAEALALRARLAAAGIDVHSDQIPYGGPDDMRYRVFTFGVDVVRAEAVLRDG